MPQFRRPSTIVFVIGFLASAVFKAKCELRVDGTKVLKRLGAHTSNGVAYANFAAHTFHYLNTTPLLSVSVNEFAECGKLCVDHFPCFSFNVAVFRDAERKIFCELLPSDKYNESSKFSSSQIFHHFSIKVCFKIYYILFSRKNSYILLVINLTFWSQSKYLCNSCFCWFKY